MRSLLTESRMSCARRCLREEHIRYQVGFKPVDTKEELRIGTVFHSALEVYWKNSGDSQLVIDAGATDLYDRAKMTAMMIGYANKWPSPRAISIEAEFRTPLINPDTGERHHAFDRAGKIDVIGHEHLYEHKTSGEDITPGSTFWTRLKLGGQAAGYIRGAQSLGHSPAGVIYDVIGKPKLRPLRAGKPNPESPDEYQARILEDIAENPDKYYQRGLIVRLESQLLEHDRETWWMANHLTEVHESGLAPRNPDACQRFGSVCSYYPVCCGEATLDDPTRFKRIDWVHSELTK